MQNDLSIEIRKLEVRLKEYVKAEKKAVESLEKYINKIKQLNDTFEPLLNKRKGSEIENAMKLRLEVAKAFQEALNHISKAEHEKSHLLQSYGSILLALEEHVQKIIGK
ncbi:MAG: hypothetical protein ACUVQX_06780 [Candidatus Bathycorpusculaceae bacterium]